MAGTVRTKAALDAIFVDDAAATFQDQQDFIASAMPPQYAAALIADPSGPDQDFAADTDEAITFDTVVWDTDSFADLGSAATRLTIPAGMGGLYLIGGVAGFTGASASWWRFYILKNGTDDLAHTRGEMTTTINRVGTLNCLDVAVATDYYEFMGVTETDVDLPHLAGYPRFWIARLGQTPA
ncbi:MAG: hypothetical protein L0Z47_11035 [Actinobacteria bacterium]|nr:hypothetical protein [Actinomycetota bacterium]